MILHTLAVGTVPAAPLQHAQHDTWYMIHGDLALAAFRERMRSQSDGVIHGKDKRN